MGAGFIYGRNLQGNAKRMTAAVEEGDKVCDANRIFDTSYDVNFLEVEYYGLSKVKQNPKKR